MIAHFPDARDLNRKPLSAFKPLFAMLAPPDLNTLAGVYEAAVTGPGWLRTSAVPSLALSGLGGWWGKEFTQADGSNLVLRDGQIQRVIPFQTTLTASAIDGKPAIVVRYTQDCPFPWGYIFDEVRQIEAGRLLGMTLIDAAGLRRMAFPFLLERRAYGEILNT